VRAAQDPVVDALACCGQSKPTRVTFAEGCKDSACISTVSSGGYNMAASIQGHAARTDACRGAGASTGGPASGDWDARDCMRA
jgi:hypothetical protein